MKRITSLLLLCPLLASAFTVPHLHQSPRTVLQVAADPNTDINLILNGNNIELTPALNDYVEKRIGGPLRKLGGGIVREVDVHLSVYKNPKVRTKFVGMGSGHFVANDCPSGVSTKLVNSALHCCATLLSENLSFVVIASIQQFKLF